MLVCARVPPFLFVISFSIDVWGRWRGLVHASVDIPTADILKIEKEGSLKMGRDVSILKVYVRPDSDALVIMEGTSFCGYGWTKKGRYRAPNLEEGALLSPAVFEFYVKKSEGIEWFTSLNEQRPNGDEGNKEITQHLL